MSRWPGQSSIGESHTPDASVTLNAVSTPEAIGPTERMLMIDEKGMVTTEEPIRPPSPFTHKPPGNRREEEGGGT